LPAEMTGSSSETDNAPTDFKIESQADKCSRRSRKTSGEVHCRYFTCRATIGQGAATTYTSRSSADATSGPMSKSTTTGR
jgi:hypothetical protein